MPLNLSGSNGVSGVDGSASTPALQGSDSNTGIHFPAADTVAIDTGGSERLRVDSSGRVGIGTTSPGMKLTVNDTTTAQIQFGYSDSIYGRIGRDSSGNYEFSSYENGGNLKFGTTTSTGSTTERARIDSSGRLLVGTSTNSGGNVVQIQGPSGTAAQSVGSLSLRSSYTPITNFSTDEIGRIDFQIADGGVCARIQGYTNGATVGTNDYPGALLFSTTADGASSPTERMRIQANGTFTNCLGIYNDTTGAAANVVVNSSGSLLRSTSSIKYKTDVENAEDQYSDALLQCRPVWYRSTCQSDNPAHSFWGFIAEEVAEIDPRLVHWKTTEPVVQENGSIENVPCDPEPEGVAYDRFVPHLLNLIKRQNERIESLETRLNALEVQP